MKLTDFFAELKRRNLSYADLADKLAELGINDNERNISNKIARGSFTVTVLADRTPPAIAGATPSQTSIWPPDKKMVPVTIAVSATDNLDPSPSCRVIGIASNQ